MAMRLCIAYPNKVAYSETFIRAHIVHLQPAIRLHGGWYPAFFNDSKTFLQFPLNLFLIRGSMKRLFPGLYHRLFTKQLVKFLSSQGVDLVLAEYGPTGCSVLDACEQTGVPLVVHFHGFDAYHRETVGRYRDAYQRMFRVARAIIVVSASMRKQLRSLGAGEEKLIVNPCGVDSNEFFGARPDQNPQTFVAIGRFVEKKAPQITIRAFSLVHQKCKDARLIMIGDGPLLPQCKRLVGQLGLAEAVDFRGVQASQHIIQSLAEARAFVQHSVQAADGDSEGMPVAVLEAGAMGLPIVSTSHGGITEAVLHGETGYLVPEGDYERMASFMLELAVNRQLAATLGSKGREHVVQNYSLESRIGKLKEIIDQAASDSAHENDNETSMHGSAGGSTVSGADVKDFYERFFRTSLLSDLLRFNVRQYEVRTLCDEFILKGSKILEVGCGIGIISRHVLKKASSLIAVDIAELNIRASRLLCGSPRAQFNVADILTDYQSLKKHGPFDVIILADVLEHLPKEKHGFVFSVLEQMLAPQGRILLTFPSPEQQDYLKKHKPDMLQIVDERVDLRELLRVTSLAPIYFAYTHAWGRNQYNHLVLTAHPEYKEAYRRTFLGGLVYRMRKYGWALLNLYQYVRVKRVLAEETPRASS